MAVEERRVHQLRSSRDLRAELLDLAAALARTTNPGRMILINPLINKATARAEWDRTTSALREDIQARLALEFENTNDPKVRGQFRIRKDLVLLDRPNYRFEVMRMLIGADLEHDGPQLLKGLVARIGSSQTPIRQALAELKEARVGYFWNPGVELSAKEVSTELLARTASLPTTLRFRYAQGAQIKQPRALLERALRLLGPEGPSAWNAFALSGTPVAHLDVPSLDLLGLPRVDLVAYVGRNAKVFQTTPIDLLDDGLEREPSVLAPAPLVITIVRGDGRFDRPREDLAGARCAAPMDVFLSLLDLGLREQAIQYATTIRPA